MPATPETQFRLLDALEQLKPRVQLDAARAQALGVGRHPREAFDVAVETLFAVLELPRPPLDSVQSLLEVIVHVTAAPQGGAELFRILGMALPPPPPQKPAPGSVAPVTAPPVVTKRGSRAMPRVLSYGGGLDSFAILVRSIEINDKPDVAIFMDVAGGTEKKDSPVPGEWPGTYKHIREIVIPMCKKAGIEFVWLGPQIPLRMGGVDEARSLIEFYEQGKKPRVPMSGDTRECTIVAKVERFETWMKQRFGNQKIEVWIGFEAGEERRVKKDPNIGKSSQRQNRFPLVEWGWCRCRSEQYVRSKRLPVPRKSACVFCPYGNLVEWQTFARELPKQFDRVVKLEARKLAAPTKRGIRISLKGYSWIGKYKKWSKEERLKIKSPKLDVHYKAPSLPVWIQGKARPTVERCEVCGAMPKAVKEVGCNWLP